MDRITHARVLKIALPIVLSNATVPLIGAVDTGVVGQMGQAAPIGAVGVGERGRHQGDRDGNDRHHPICSASTAKKSEWRSQGTLNRSGDGHSWMVLRRRRPHCADR